MFRINTKSSCVMAALFVAGLFVFLTEPVFALTISPVRMEISGDPGQTLYGEIELFNEQSETKSFYSSTANFEAKGDSGAPYFLPDTSRGLASWIEVQKNVTLKAGERMKIPFTIKIPAGTGAGGYFAAILWGTSPDSKQGNDQVSLGGKLGVLLLLSVSGEVKEGGGLLDLKIDEAGRFVNTLPITFVYRFFNDGDERIKPAGELKIKNLFGFTVKTFNANPQSGNVLPKSIRKFSVVWTGEFQETGKEKESGFFAAVRNQWRNFALGPYKAELNLSYGKLSEAEATKKAEASFRFFIISWQLLSIIVVILGFVGFLGFIGLKKYNQWIIKKAQGGGLKQQ